jgi:hypothetical protein
MGKPVFIGIAGAIVPFLEETGHDVLYISGEKGICNGYGGSTSLSGFFY